MLEIKRGVCLHRQAYQCRNDLHMILRLTTYSSALKMQHSSTSAANVMVKITCNRQQHIRCSAPGCTLVKMSYPFGGWVAVAQRVEQGEIGMSATPRVSGH